MSEPLSKLYQRFFHSHGDTARLICADFWQIRMVDLLLSPNHLISHAQNWASFCRVFELSPDSEEASTLYRLWRGMWGARILAMGHTLPSKD